MEEEIKVHPIYSDYGSDKNGKVYSKKLGEWKKLKQYKNKQGGIKHAGYYNFGVSISKKSKLLRSHKFIYECFFGYIDMTDRSTNGFVIHHIDKDKYNNKIENLELIKISDHSNKHKK